MRLSLASLEPDELEQLCSEIETVASSEARQFAELLTNYFHVAFDNTGFYLTRSDYAPDLLTQFETAYIAAYSAEIKAALERLT